MLYQSRGATEEALDKFTAALDGFRAAADPIGQAHVLGQIAQIELDRDEPAAAGAHLADALEMCREVGNRRVEVQLRVRQCELMLHEDRCTEARAVLTTLLSAVRESGDIVGQSKILHQLGRANAGLGDLDLAEQLFAEALTVLEQNRDHVGADRVREELARLGDS
jgi:tetratricopeptide (TPR) repeat protein